MPTPRASEREAMPCGRLHPHAAHVEAGLLPCPGVLAPDDPLACICDFSPHTTGPEQSCPQHGDVRWYAQMWAEASAEITRLRHSAPDDLREQIARALHVDNVKRPEMHVDCEPAPSEARAAATVMDVLRRNGVIRQ